MKRWKATINYRTNSGLVDVAHEIEEMSDLHDIVERGPDWNAISSIRVTLARKSDPHLTVEKASEV